MDLYKILEYLEESGHMFALDYAKKCLYSAKLSNYIFGLFDISERGYLGVIYTRSIRPGERYIIDGLSRLVSVSLFLLAVCECWKNTSERNELIVRKIKGKYLLKNDRPKIILPEKMNKIYESLLLGERLSGRDKKTILFCIYHEYWTKLKLGKYDLKEIMDKLENLYLYHTDLEVENPREFYYVLNSDNPNLNQIGLIRDFMKENDASYEWSEIEQLFYSNRDYLMMFLRDYLITKYKTARIPNNSYYVVLKDYINHLKKYRPVAKIVEQMHASAITYNNLLSIDIPDESIKNKFVAIKFNKGDDTYAYLLEIYEDYQDGNISKETLLEILTAVNEYLVNRLANNESSTNFNDLITDLNNLLYGDGSDEFEPEEVPEIEE